MQAADVVSFIIDTRALFAFGNQLRERIWDDGRVMGDLCHIGAFANVSLSERRR